MAFKTSSKRSDNRFGTSVGRPFAAALAKRAAPKEPATAAKASRKAPRRVARQDSEAVQALTRAIEVFYKQQWAKAAEQFREILNAHSKDDAVVLDRVRTYLRIAERNQVPPAKPPKGAEECYQFGILALNAGNLEAAAAHFKTSISADPKSDRACYGLAAVHALGHEPVPALAALREAIALNPENRALAANDSDLESLRDEPEFLELVGSPRGRNTPRPAALEAGDESE